MSAFTWGNDQRPDLLYLEILGFLGVLFFLVRSLKILLQLLFLSPLIFNELAKLSDLIIPVLLSLNFRLQHRGLGFQRLSSVAGGTFGFAGSRLLVFIQHKLLEFLHLSLHLFLVLLKTVQLLRISRLILTRLDFFQSPRSLIYVWAL